jgi:hypothetical protein
MYIKVQRVELICIIRGGVKMHMGGARKVTKLLRIR